MRNVRTVAPIMVLALSTSIFHSTPASARERHVVAPAALATVVTEHSRQRDADRSAVIRTLRHPEVLAVASQVGIAVDRLQAAVDGLSPAALTEAASTAQQVDQVLIGGASTVTISTTTIIIVLLIVILVAIA